MRQTDYVILGLLSESALTGYQIKKIIEHRFSFFWNESYGQLYPALKALKECGWIEEAAQDTEKKRAQKTYRIRKEGVDALREWLKAPVERETLRLEILLKLYFAHLSSSDALINQLQTFEQTHEKDLKTLRMYESELKPIIDNHPNHFHVLRVIDFGIKVNEAYLNWCSETLELLKGGQAI